MGMSTYSAATLEPRIQMTAMAAIVQDLLTGERSRREDSLWLRERAHEAGLGLHAYAALETLRVRLGQSGMALSTSIQNILSGLDGNW